MSIFTQDPHVVCNRSLSLAVRVHKNEARKFNPNVPYVFHCVDVTDKVIRYSGLTGKELRIAMAVSPIHDTVENTKDAKERESLIAEIYSMFGAEVGDGVLALSKNELIVNLGKDSKNEQTLENLDRLQASRISIQATKMEDRHSNLEYLPPSWSDEKVYNYLEESILIAHRLGPASTASCERLLLQIEKVRKSRLVLH